MKSQLGMVPGIASCPVSEGNPRAQAPAHSPSLCPQAGLRSPGGRGHVSSNWALGLAAFQETPKFTLLDVCRWQDRHLDLRFCSSQKLPGGLGLAGLPQSYRLEGSVTSEGLPRPRPVPGAPLGPGAELGSGSLPRGSPLRYRNQLLRGLDRCAPALRAGWRGEGPGRGRA